MSFKCEMIIFCNYILSPNTISSTINGNDRYLKIATVYYAFFHTYFFHRNVTYPSYCGNFNIILNFQEIFKISQDFKEGNRISEISRIFSSRHSEKLIDILLVPCSRLSSIISVILRYINFMISNSI